MDEQEYFERDSNTGELTKMGEVAFRNCKVENPSSEITTFSPLKADGTIVVTTSSTNGIKKEESSWKCVGDSFEKNGVTKLFYEDGSILMEIDFKNNKHHGDCWVWNEDGDVVQYMEYEDGELITLQAKKTRGEDFLDTLIGLPINELDKNQPTTTNGVLEKFVDRLENYPEKYTCGGKPSKI